MPCGDGCRALRPWLLSGRRTAVVRGGRGSCPDEVCLLRGGAGDGYHLCFSPGANVVFPEKEMSARCILAGGALLLWEGNCRLTNPYRYEKENLCFASIVHRPDGDCQGETARPDGRQHGAPATGRRAPVGLGRRRGHGEGDHVVGPTDARLPGRRRRTLAADGPDARRQLYAV